MEGSAMWEAAGEVGEAEHTVQGTKKRAVKRERWDMVMSACNRLAEWLRMSTQEHKDTLSVAQEIFTSKTVTQRLDAWVFQADGSKQDQIIAGLIVLEASAKLSLGFTLRDVILPGTTASQVLAIQQELMSERGSVPTATTDFKKFASEWLETRLKRDKRYKIPLGAVQQKSVSKQEALTRLTPDSCHAAVSDEKIAEISTLAKKLLVLGHTVSGIYTSPHIINDILAAVYVSALHVDKIWKHHGITENLFEYICQASDIRRNALQSRVCMFRNATLALALETSELAFCIRSQAFEKEGHHDYVLKNLDGLCARLPEYRKKRKLDHMRKMGGEEEGAAEPAPATLRENVGEASARSDSPVGDALGPLTGV
eukprot:TRINITY_DN3389_c0_g1_i1.p1 TRINITY_DN3389_c0_g1~~TRINITY_DN3389_c0_g1_i1.p1  ORF type:complete len:420 (+),score=45.99 TRINITY_DN3389_c0_g1_i1:151-1260(+)